MSGRTLDGNPAASTFTGAEIFALIQSGADVSGTLNQALSFIKNSIVANASQAISANNSYIANGSSTIQFTLPTTISAGSEIKITGYGTGGWQVLQNAGQQILFQSSQTTLGNTGAINSTNRTDSCALICVVDNTIFVLRDISGNINFT